MYNPSFYRLLCSLGCLVLVACQSKDTGPKICQAFHRNGALKYEVPCQNGVFHGLYKQYSEDGNLWRETVYEQGVMVDTTRYYYSKLGKILKVIPMVEGKISGVSTEFYKSGTVRQVTNYVAGQKTGPMYTLSETGDTTAYVTYQGDLADGPARMYRPDGSLILVAHMDQDSLLPEMRYYPEQWRELQPNTFHVGDRGIPLRIPIEREGLVVYFKRNAYGEGLEVSVEEI